jgi:hypothetical protein
MGVRDEVLAKLKSGLKPGDIAKERGITLITVLGYLDQLVGQGRLRRSDILFSIPTEIRQPILNKLSDGHSQSISAIMGRLQRMGLFVDEDDIRVVQKYYDARHALGEIYEDIRAIELGLHERIREALEKEFGPEESGWWRRGIAKEIRVKCQQRREEEEIDSAPEPYRYTDLIDLRTILDKQWAILSRHLPRQATSDKKALLNDLIRLNQIRRMVMHPVRGSIPTEDDFYFLRTLKEKLEFD